MQHVRKTSNSPRGSVRGPARNFIEGLGVEKTSFLLHGPWCGRSTDIGAEHGAYKTEAAARKDWKAYRSELMATETDPTRRPWAFWNYDQDMDKPSPADEEARVILELELYRSKAERELLEATVAQDEEDQRMEAERVRLGYRKTTPK